MTFNIHVRCSSMMFRNFSFQPPCSIRVAYDIRGSHLGGEGLHDLRGAADGRQRVHELLAQNAERGVRPRQIGDVLGVEQELRRKKRDNE